MITQGVAGQGTGPVAMEVGEDLPSELQLNIPELQAEEQLELIFAGQDLYGNRTYQTLDNLLNLAIAEVGEEIVPESPWLENF